MPDAPLCVPVESKTTPGESATLEIPVSPGESGRSDTDTDSHSEPEPEPHSQPHSDPEQKPPEEKVEAPSAGTGTKTGGLVQSRYHGKILFESVMTPLLGVEDGTMHAPKSPKYNRDLVCLDAWYNERVWPPGQDTIGQARLTESVEAASKAMKMSTNPMAYMGDFTGRFAQEDARVAMAEDNLLRAEGLPNAGLPERRAFPHQS